MLEIKPCTEKAEILPYCRKCKLVYTDALYLYRAIDGSQILASALFSVDSLQVDILYYESELADDHLLFDAILRAGLNYADSQGIPTGYIPESFHQEHAHLFQKLNFPPETTFQITNFFNRYKNCKSYY